MAALKFNVVSVELEKTWPVAHTLFTVIDDYLQPGSTATAQETAEKLHALRPDVCSDTGTAGMDKDAVKTFMWNFWVLFVEIAREIPHDHPSQDRAVQLVFALRILADSPQGEGWTGVGTTLHDWLSIDTFDPHSTEPDNLVRKAHMMNLHAFAARLTESSYEDYSYASIWALAAALEDIPDPRAKAWQTQGPVLDAWVPVAAEWMGRAGDVVLRKCNTEVHAEGQAFPNSIKNGRKGFFPARWQFWRETFGKVGEMEQASAATRDIARRAHAKMVELEK